MGRSRSGVASRSTSRTDTRLLRFRKRFPMDDRAFDFLRGSRLEVQDVVLNDFNLRRKREEDYSAPVTAFVRAVSLRIETKKGGRRVDMKSNFLRISLNVIRWTIARGTT